MGGIAWAWGGKRRGRRRACESPRTRAREGDRIAHCAGVCGQPCVARHFVPRVRACSAMGARAHSRTSPRTHARAHTPRERRHRGVDAGACVLRVACLCAELDLELELRLKPSLLCVRACASHQLRTLPPPLAPPGVALRFLRAQRGMGISISARSVSSLGSARSARSAGVGAELLGAWR